MAPANRRQQPIIINAATLSPFISLFIIVGIQIKKVPINISRIIIVNTLSTITPLSF